VHNKKLYVKDARDEDELWKEVLGYRETLEAKPDEQKLKEEFAAVLTKLQEKGTGRLKLPEKGERARKGLTDEIVEELKGKRAEYASALSKCKGDPDIDSGAFNEVLRISYNFANDVLPYLRLVISICDLKPVILWTTIGEHYLLSEAFRNLPWGRSKYKESLKGYRDTVANARNKAFHDIFPFQKALHCRRDLCAMHK